MTMLTSSRFSRSIAVALALGLSLGLVLPLISAPPPAAADTAPVDPSDPGSPPTVSADALPTVQIDGVAWAQVVVGNTVYVAGDFRTARPAGAAPGVNTVPRNNLLAYNIETGNLITSFAPNLNGQALGITASPDGSRIYVVGDFTTVNGAGYFRMAAFDTATGQVIPSFRPVMGSQVRAVTATNTTVYAGGVFQSVNGQTRRFLAAMNASDGSLTNWTADADAMVYAITLTKDNSKVIAGGRFAHIEGADHYGLVALDSGTGDTVAWAAPAKVRDAGPRAAIMSLHATDDRVYGSGYVFGSNEDGNLEGIFSADPDTGAIQWIEDCHGDTVSVWTLGDVVYGAGHPHYCGNIGGFPQTEPWTMHHTVAFSKAATGTITPDPYGYFNWAGNPSPTLLNWFPNWIVGSYTGQGQAVWNLSGNDRYITAAGDFPYVNGVAQYGLTRFAIPEIAPNKVGPVVNPELVPTAASFNSGEVRVSWTATYDRDNTHLSYRVVRDNNNASPVYETTQDSTFWIRPAMGFIDKGLTPGSTHTYRVYVTDPFGNSISRLGSPVMVSAENSGGPYSDAVAEDNPTAFWPLDESSGSIGFDHVGFTDLRLESGVSRGAPGPIDDSTASRFNGSGNGFGVTAAAVPGPDTFTTETWIRTTTDDGGKIIGFGNQDAGNSSNYDRHVYMTNDGRIWFGVHPGGVRTVNSSQSFNDGNWHQVVATLGSSGMRLYVDGVLVGSRDDVTFGQDYDGFWRVGGDNLNGWTSRPRSDYFDGDIGLVSVYPTALSRAAIVDHFVAAGRTSPIPPAPADDYGAAVYNADPTIFWRLDETAGTTASDSGQQENHGQYNGSVTKGQSGALADGTGNSARFAQPSGVSSNTLFNNPTTYSLETWFQTTTNVGGKLIGFGNERTGQSSNYDRHLYMQDDGTLVFGVWTGFTNTITTPASYNDGQWHHAVATQSSVGMRLYVDGALVGTNSQVAAQSYSGYWRIGGDTTWSSSNAYFAGNLDEVAVYSQAISADTVAAHYALGSTGVVPNQAPTAAFTSSVTNLSASFNAGTSSDPDGSISTYAWDFGDGSTGSGVTATHDYATAGDFDVTLTVTDNQSATGTVTHQVSTTLPPVNAPPVAEFMSSSSGLTASFDGTGSSDSDGTITTYSWDFGDGQTGVGQTPTHAYAANGTYTVTLTVTDDDTATGTISHDVTVTAPTTNVLAQDAFGRTVASGWGGADVGGSWSITGNAASLQVGGGTGQVNLGAGSTRVATLPAVSSDDTDSRVEFSLDTVPTGGGAYIDLIGKQVGSASYAAEVWVRPTGAVHLIVKQGSAILSNTQVAGLTYTAGTKLQLRFQVSADTPTTLRAKVWTGVEPSAWQSTVTDSTSALQQPGAIALKSYLSGSATSPLTIRYDNLAVTGGSAPAPNAAPVAAFTSSTSGLTAAFDAATSTDSDGTISSYSWTFGDGGTGTGVNPSHAYAAAGTFTVGLTVTDDDGATNAISHDVTVTAPTPDQPIAQDNFEVPATGGWGNAMIGGPWSHAGSAAAYSVSGGFGLQVVPNGSTKTSSLAGASSSAVNLGVSFSADRPATGGGIYVSAIGRDVGATNYQARVWMQATGEMRLQLLQGSTPMQTVIPAGLSYAPGTTYNLRLEVFGTSPTTIRAKVWAGGQAEPATWQASITDGTPALQGAGSMGLRSYVSASATDIPVTVRFDNLLVRPQQ